MKNLIFLDVDGVLNCELFYREQFAHLKKFPNTLPLYRNIKNWLKKKWRAKEVSDLDYYKSQICGTRIKWLNELCEETDTAVVLSASMRSGHTVERLNEIFKYAGATFTIIDKTGHCECRVRGVEIKEWLDNNCMKYFGVHGHEFYRYAIIDDDSDMLLNQGPNFFHTDSYSGLTPNTLYKIDRFFKYKI